MTCPEDSYYDVNKKQCLRCPDGFKFDLGTYKGVKSETFPSTPSCPESHPFFDGTYCVQCALPRYWNSEENKCY